MGSCAMHLVPRGPGGVELKSKSPNIWWNALSLGLIRDLRSRLSVRTVCGMSWHQMCGGKSVSVPFRMEMKWALKVCVALSARFRLCMCVLTSW